MLRYVSPTTKKRRNAGLGAYPEISIVEAGKRAQQMREQLTQGLDPLEIKAATATTTPAAMAIPTFELAARTLHTELSPG